MLLTIEIFSIILMAVILFISIWGFILVNRIFGQLRYKNYLFEKLIEAVKSISKKKEDEN